MTFQIDPNTEKGKAQLEGIGWAQEQLNEILRQYFNGKYKIQKGLRIFFRLGLDLQMNEKIKVDVEFKEPQTEEEFNEAVEEALAQLPFEKVVDPKKGAE